MSSVVILFSAVKRALCFQIKRMLIHLKKRSLQTHRQRNIYKGIHRANASRPNGAAKISAEAKLIALQFVRIIQWPVNRLARCPEDSGGFAKESLPILSADHLVNPAEELNNAA